MSTLEIPLFPGVPLYDIRATLDGREYLLAFDWNGREGRFYMSVSSSDGTPIMSGRKVVANWLLLRKVTGPAKPPGDLTAIDYSNQGGEPPGLDELGVRVKLIYFTAS